MSGDEDATGRRWAEEEGEEASGGWVEDKVRVRGSHLSGVSAGGCWDGPSAALGVEVEQGATREARDKLRQGQKDDRDEF